MSPSPRYFFDQLEPVANSDLSKRFDQRAAVLLLLQETKQGLSILLTQRADSLKHHGGEVAFPGGMWEEKDGFPVDTALRESNEEVNLPISAVDILGQLTPTYSRTGTQVTPVVAMLKHKVDLQPNIEETQAIFWLPIRYLLDDPRQRTDIFSHHRRVIWVPAYHYQGYEIWGLTSSVIVEFLNRCSSHTIRREHDAPEKHWKA